MKLLYFTITPAIIVVGIALLSQVHPPSANKKTPSPKKTNIVLILSDDLNLPGYRGDLSHDTIIINLNLI